jgi:hypothetical protein
VIDRRTLASALAGFVVLFTAVAAILALRPHHGISRAVRQPIAFNHRKHVVDNSLECSTCHEYYEKEAFSGIPSAELCASCHQEPQGKSEEEARLVRLLRSGAPLDWKPLFRQPAHVFYSHRRHVVAAKLDCRVCHGEIGKSTQPASRVRRLQMTDCIECHRKRGVSTDCTACHR